jgi:hypothetical protein
VCNSKGSCTIRQQQKRQQQKVNADSNPRMHMHSPKSSAARRGELPLCVAQVEPHSVKQLLTHSALCSTGTLQVVPIQRKRLSAQQKDGVQTSVTTHTTHPPTHPHTPSIPFGPHPASHRATQPPLPTRVSVEAHPTDTAPANTSPKSNSQ